MIMKYIIFLLGLIPAMLFAQERQQKLNFRNYGSAPSRSFSSPAPSYQQPERRSYEQYQKENYRREREEYRFHGGGTNNYYYYDPYWDLGWNRWYGWGAPRWGWNYWQPYWYYDSWGYRQPARVYVYKDGRADTIKGQKIRVSLGLQANKSELGGFITIGNKTFFVAEYQGSYQSDKSLYYLDLTAYDVIPWQDKRLADIKKSNSVYLGVGQKFGRTGVFGALGIINEKIRYQYFDELFILSNNGRYSFSNYTDNYYSLKLGVLHDLKRSTLKFDYDIVKNAATFGLGVNF